MQKIAEVIVDISHSEVDRVFDYLLPENMAQVGDRVAVPFGPKPEMEGFILRIKDTSDYPYEKLKAVKRKLDTVPVLNEELIELALWISDKYHAHIVDAIRLMLPPLYGRKMIAPKSKKMLRLIQPKGELTEEIQALAQKNNKLYKVLDFLITNDTADKSLLVELFGNIDSQIKTLSSRGWIEQYDEPVIRSPYLQLTSQPDEKKRATDAQSKAIAAICQGIDQGNGAYMLKGVTGSGKTEVYLQAIEYAFSKGMSAIVLVPEISLTPQTVSRFRSRFGNRVAVLHSALSAGERADEWRRIRNREADLVVGARSAVFAPVTNLGLIVIDEEHENSYRSEMTPKYDAIEVAEKRAENSGVVVLGSATPSVERFYIANQGKYSILRLDKRINNKPLPQVELVDMRDEFRFGNRGIFSDKLKEGLEETLKTGGQAILFLNRRGYSTFVMCRECGHVLGCENCDAQLTYHQKSGRLTCHYCATDYPIPDVCPECGSKYIKYFGTGTERIEEEVNKLFPDAGVLRMDMDTVSGKDSHMKILSEFGKGEKKVLVGTQMVTKGLDFPNVALVGVVAADIGLFMPDYRAGERTFQLITQVAGRAGRKDRDGRVIVQTYSPTHASIALAANHDYDGFYENEIELRRRGLYPPFGDLLRAVFSSESEADAQSCCFAVRDKLNEFMKKANVIYFDAMRAPMGKLKGVYRWQIILRLKRNSLSEAIMDKFIETCDEEAKRKVYVSVDINPINMM